jgi:hypothetical protein
MAAGQRAIVGKGEESGRGIEMNARAHWLTSVVFALACLIPTQAISDEKYKTIITTAPGSPVQFNACETWARDYITRVDFHRFTIPNALVDVGVNFTNTSPKKIKDVRFGFVAYDAFGAAVSSVLLDTSQNVSADAVSMDPGASIDLMGPKGWHLRSEHHAVDHIACSVEKVAFDDGSIWSTASPAPVISPAPSPSPYRPLNRGKSIHVY